MRKISYCKFLLLSGAIVLIASCGIKSRQVLVTSESGDVLKEYDNIVFKKQKVEGLTVSVDLENKRQIVDGVGASLTESSAFVLAHLTPEKREELLKEIFGEQGANFAIVRTQIGASDFSVEGKYSLAEMPDDTLLTSFSLNRDKEGFSKSKYPGVVDTTYDLFPLMKDVASIKKNQEDKEFRIVASPWTAPDWMKDNKAYYQWTYGGSLLKKYYGTYSNYLVKYLEEYKKEGIDIWGITPENEPMGNYGSWESMHFKPEEEAELIGKYLGPALEKSGFSNVKIMGFDQNTPDLPEWAKAILGNPESAKYTYGMAIHWYASTFDPFENIMDSVHNLFPNFAIIHTEGCVDNLGAPAYDAIKDKEGWQEKGWFKNDKWWWNTNATDWGYTGPFQPELHPKYVPVHRYARNIIEGMNNWMTGFIDWNIILDKKGGPNHVNNFCGAPIMIDTDNGDIHYTPVYSVLKQFSKTIRPGDIALRATPVEGAMKDSLYVGAVLNKNNEVVASILNVTKNPIEFNLTLGEYTAKVTAPANSLQSIIVPSPKK